MRQREKACERGGACKSEARQCEKGHDGARKGGTMRKRVGHRSTQEGGDVTVKCGTMREGMRE